MKLYKHFNELSHLESFVKGNVRFSELRYFRSVEGARQDVTEGISHSKIGKVNAHQQLKRDVYIFCTTTETNDKNFCNFGNHIAEIQDHSQFLFRLNKSLSNSGIEVEDGGVQCDWVRYTKGLPAGSADFSDIYLKKPKIFSFENEYRYFFISKSYGSDALVTLKIDPAALVSKAA